jgi:hypothetical protein
MFSSAGGGPSLPSMNSPFEILVVLAVLAVIVWLGFRFFSD